MDMNQYLDIFLEESKEHLQNLNKNLLELEKENDNKNIVDEIFRTAHTLKGMAGTMGFVKISTLTHEMESILQEIRMNNLKVDGHVIDILFEALDCLEKMIGNIADNLEEGNVEILKVMERLKNLSVMKAKMEVTAAKDTVFNQLNEIETNILQQAIEKGYNTFKIIVTMSNDCLLKSARAFIVFTTLEKYGEIIKTVPSVQDIEDEKFDREITFYIITPHSMEIIDNQLSKISELERINIEAISLEKKKNSEYINNQLNTPTEEGDNGSTDKTSEGKKLKIGKTVRVDIERLDSLMNLVSELIIIKTRLDEISFSVNSSNLTEATEYLERITTSLHDAVMKVRMVPIEQVFNRFPRMVRDLAKELDKEIILKIDGAETELDRTVIDEIGDPLIHLIRNSIDHGIESPEQRQALGKNPAGLVKLNAYQDGNNVVIEVMDDGRGIDIEKVRNKAKNFEHELDKPVEQLDNKELISLLFKPGFSTADTISDLSGRGVGLDVVKTKIEALGGTIEIETKKNIGSMFIVRLPLTLAIIQALMVYIGQEIYAIPLNSIKETLTVEKGEIKKIRGQEVILFRGSILPIIRLSEVLEIDYSDDKDQLTVVIVKKGDKNVGVIVEDLIGQQEIVIKSLGKLLNHIKIIAGATILGDGKVALILDVNALL